MRLIGRAPPEVPLVSAPQSSQGRCIVFPGLEFRHLSFFVAVAEECSFTRAAERLHVSQPALSQGIRQLEDGLAATLFVRGPAGTALSPAGIAFLPFAKDLLQRRDEAARTANAVHHGRDMPLRFGYSPFVSRGLVREALSAYSELVPSGSIEQSSDGSAALVRMVSERTLDAALVTLPISDSKLTLQTVCKERYLVCLRADDPFATHIEIPKDAASRHLRIFVARAQNPLFSDTLEHKLARAGVSVHPTNFVATPSDLMFQVQAGHGWGLVRESLRVEDDLIKRNIAGLKLSVKTGFICHRLQERPVLPLLAYRLAKTCQNLVSAYAPKKPSESVRPPESVDLKDIA